MKSTLTAARAALAGLLAIVIVTFSPGALAETVPLKWTNADKYSNGTPLPLSQIVGVEIDCIAFTPNGSTTAQPCTAGRKTAPAPTTAAQTYDFDVGTVPVTGGTYAFVARTKVAAALSDATPQATWLFAAVKPNPPQNFATVPVVAGLHVSPAYRILRDGSRGEQVAGFLAVGSQCTGRVVFEYRGQKYRRVKPEDVQWWNTRPTTDVAAACEPA